MLSGRLHQRAKGILLYGQTVSLMRRGIGSTAWTTRAVVKTDTNGRANFGYRPGNDSEFQWVWSGSPAGDPSSGPIIRVFVRPSVTGALTKPAVARGGVVRMKGTVAPAVAGARIVLQRYVSGSWRDLSHTTFSASGAYDFNVPTKVRGSRAYRVYRPADSRHVSAIGPIRTLTVT